MGKKDPGTLSLWTTVEMRLRIPLHPHPHPNIHQANPTNTHFYALALGGNLPPPSTPLHPSASLPPPPSPPIRAHSNLPRVNRRYFMNLSRSAVSAIRIAKDCVLRGGGGEMGRAWDARDLHEGGGKGINHRRIWEEEEERGQSM